MRHFVAAGLAALVFSPVPVGRAAAPAVGPPIHVSFLWHLHQPVYWPYETVIQTEAQGRYGYSVVDIHMQRGGPYTAWPRDAVDAGIAAGFHHAGAQVSISGSLIENLNALESAGNGSFQGWKNPWNGIRSQGTALGNPRMDLVGFGYYHPLMGLLDPFDLRKQIQFHRTLLGGMFAGPVSRGFFPPETAFSTRIIPALAAEGIEWVLVDNIHMDRACTGYPFSTSGNLVEPNLADVRNANPGDWRALTGLWAPTPVSGGWGHRPHRAEYVDPATGAVSRIVVVPAERYMGNEDGRGGFGALDYDGVMSQLESYNTDPAHPLLIVLHHDGDNYGGGTDAYYHHNFQSFVSWLEANPSRFVWTTVEDYLEQYPPDSADVIHVEDGSWSGADNGDPEFKKWLGDPVSGYSPDRNSWAVMTAARNAVAEAERVNPSAPATVEAWRWLLCGEASDYWYWDGSQGGVWDSHPTRAANQAVALARSAAGASPDLTGPTVFPPQREPYNPGGTEWGAAQTSDFEVWTYAYDESGLASVTLRVRRDVDGVDSFASVQNDTYAGGAEVTAWTSIPMTSSDAPSQTNPLPVVRALRHAAMVAGYEDALLDYYVEALDTEGNLTRSPIRHVWVGSGGGAGAGTVSWTPTAPDAGDVITVRVEEPGKTGALHWGLNGWQNPVAAYRPPGSLLYGGTGPSVETPFGVSGGDLVLALGPFDNATQAVSALDFVIHYDDGTWDNNSGADYHVAVTGGALPWVMDGSLDAGAVLVSANGGTSLWAGWNGSDLYVASQAAGPLPDDVFLFVASDPSILRAAPWAKSGQTGAWAAFVGNETSNNWAGWFDQTAAAAVAAGSVVEGRLPLAAELGSVPAVVYLAAGRYQDPDGGGLTAQAPLGDGDAALEGAEFAAFPIGNVGVGEPGDERPLPFLLAPNPLRGEGVVSFTMAAAGRATLRVFDVAGRERAVLLDRILPEGPHTARWVRGDLPGGVYFVELRAGERRGALRVVLVP